MSTVAAAGIFALVGVGVFACAFLSRNAPRKAARSANYDNVNLLSREGGGEEDEDEDEESEEEEEEEDRDSGDVESRSSRAPQRGSLKAFVALRDQVYSIQLPLGGVQSWAQLSQTIHESCEDSDVPDLPVHGIMHIVLNVNGATVPVTGRTPLDELWRAKAVKVSITDDGAGEAQAEEEPPSLI